MEVWYNSSAIQNRQFCGFPKKLLQIEGEMGLETSVPRSVKRKREEEYLKESLEEKRNMRRKEDDNSDVQKTSPTMTNLKGEK